MDLSQYQNITNHFQDMHLVSLRNWKDAATIQPQDNGGPYLVAQEGFDPEDVTLTPDEFLLGRSGQWLATKFFFRMPVAERRVEFVFGTATEVTKLLESLPPKPVVQHPAGTTGADIAEQPDELVATFLESKQANPKERPS